jgi:two-component system, cell cycle response regulator
MVEAASAGPHASRPPLVLVVEDEEWCARAIQTILGPRGYAVLRAYSGRQALEHAMSALPDAILLDDALQDIASHDVCRRLVDDARTASTPIVMMTTGSATRARRVEAFRAGAWEFMALPPDAEELLLRLETYVRAKVSTDRAREDGLLDGASGLYNLRGLLRRAVELGAEANRYERPLACVVITVAPAAVSAGGEDELRGALLQSLEQVFRTTVRSCDAIGRLGPNQFAVLTPATDDVGAQRLAERLLLSVETGTSPADPASLNARAGCFGVTNFREAALQPSELLVRAALALRDQAGERSAARIQHFAAKPTLQ